MVIEKKESEFLQRATRFCNKIDNYIPLFNISVEEVEELKENTLQFANVFGNSKHYSMSNQVLTNNKLQNMRVGLSYLAQLCKNSKNYTVQIGFDLGIEVPVYAFKPN